MVPCAAHGHNEREERRDQKCFDDQGRFRRGVDRCHSRGRLARSREVVTTLATAHHLPPENLIAPDSVRRLAWTPPAQLTVDTVSEALAGYGARRWQVELLAPGLTKALENEE